MNVKHGNAKSDRDTRGWLIGVFRDNELHNEDVEIKWGIHIPGDERSYDQRTAQKTATTLAILVSGDMSIMTQDASGKPIEALLQTQGDYVVWGPSIMHWYTVRKDTVVVIVRWPSVPNDTIYP